MNVAAGSQSTPLTFVLSTYEAANWVINVPEGVTVAHVFLVSFRSTFYHRILAKLLVVVELDFSLFNCNLLLWLYSDVILSEVLQCQGH